MFQINKSVNVKTNHNKPMMAFLAALAVGLGVFSSSANAALPQCAPEDYVRVDAAEVRVVFQGSDYEPRCVSVKPGTRVFLPGSDKHPFQAMEDVGGVKNPFASVGVTRAEVSEVLSAPGEYGYFCPRHGDITGDGMAGGILVSE